MILEAGSSTWLLPEPDGPTIAPSMLSELGVFDEYIFVSCETYAAIRIIHDNNNASGDTVCQNA